MQIIKDQKLIDNDWIHLADDDPIPERDAITVSSQRWANEKHEALCRRSGLGIRLNPDDLVEDIVEDLELFQIIGVCIPIFTDGRCFSIARLLRERYQYDGEIRAIGDFLPDQVFFLSRVGFNAFEFDNPEHLNEGLNAFEDFSVKYQASSDVPEALYKRVDLTKLPN